MVANIRFYSSLYAQQIFNNFFGAFVFVTFQHCYLIFNINVPTHQTSVGQGRLDANMVIKSKLKRNLINVHLFIQYVRYSIFSCTSIKYTDSFDIYCKTLHFGNRSEK